MNAIYLSWFDDSGDVTEDIFMPIVNNSNKQNNKKKKIPKHALCYINERAILFQCQEEKLMGGTIWAPTQGRWVASVSQRQFQVHYWDTS